MTDGYYPQAIKRVNKVAFWPGNLGFEALVMHIAQDNSRPKGDDYLGSTPGKSAHLFVNRDGSVKQFVSIFNSAWANGLSLVNGVWISPEKSKVIPRWPTVQRRAPVNPNRYTVSMEHQGNPADKWSSEMFNSTVAIMKWLAPLKGVAWWIPGVNLIGHGDINPIDKPNCPGPNCNMQALALAANAKRMVVLADTPIYEVPAVNPTRIALTGSAHLTAGIQVIVGMGYPNGMLWLADGLGFVEGSKLRVV